LVEWDIFEKAAIEIINISSEDNKTQNDAIKAPINESLYLVAGPGSGKTTVIVLRVLKLIFVDNIDPSQIMVTTFTKKAASELLSRILTWGEILSAKLSEYVEDDDNIINFNSIKIGTLDSIIEEIMRDYRDTGVPKPILIEDFVINALNTNLLWSKYKNKDLQEYLGQLNGKKLNKDDMSPINKLILEIKDKIYYDLIKLDDFESTEEHEGVPILCECILNYKELIEERLLFDFTRLEFEFFEKIKSQEIEYFADLKFILVDEYQDTNYIQEQIYFEIAKYPLDNGGSISIVGDDDQSLYRFRGAIVELFHDFKNRIKDQIGVELEPTYLSKNYRSTDKIVDFCNAFAELDSEYQNARVNGKPPIENARLDSYTNFPVLGMFRENIDDLSKDLAAFIDAIVNEAGYTFSDNDGNEFTIKIDPEGGSAADISLLGGSPKEIDYNGNEKFPLLFRNELNNLNNPIGVFNPRGQGLEKITEIKTLCGLILECIDPDSEIQDNEIKSKNVKNIFNGWRECAIKFINTDPSPKNPTLKKFVTCWQDREPLFQNSWPREVVVIDLVYKLITWIPYLQDDLEGLVYLEGIIRAISQAALFSYSESKITFDNKHPEYEKNSIKYIIKDIFIPIALGSIDIEESLIEETLPPNRLSIMSIHQSKGLQFPLVIVDVGCHIKTDSWMNSNKRFPRYKNGTTEVAMISSVNIEDTFNNCSNNCPSPRSNLNRAFDDIIRQYFVSFSRAQDVLLLIGLNTVRRNFTDHHGNIKRIPNVATGWDRNGTWQWGYDLENLLHI
jgi:DNA helicase-2/ATP-dependent DNA helicase PcrA